MTKSEATRKRILDTALDQFRERGFAEATMRQIASGAGVAVGLAYYYFRSKDEMVMAFYDRASLEMQPLLAEALEKNRKLESRMRALIQVKLDYFEPNKRFLGALMTHAADPDSPLSPFSSATSEMRDRDVAWFARALEVSGVKVPADLGVHLPRLLWMYQMGLILYWIYDRSPERRRTIALLDKSLPIVTGLIRLSSVPLMRPLRRKVVEVVETAAIGIR